MTRITYILGAGASCQVVPINEGISESLKRFILLLDAFSYADDLIIANKKNLIADLNWMLKASENHASIDTFAKKLYIRGDWKSLVRLRLAFSVFFSAIQMGVVPDKRYDSFFASIIKESAYSLPKEIKVLTWNYDYQMELSYASFAGCNSIHDSKSYLRCIEKHANFYNDNSDSFKLFKLNGDISIKEGKYNSAIRPFFDTLDSVLTAESFINLLSTWVEQKKSEQELCSNISFAWEASSARFLEYIVNSIQDTTILVIIGYSFPYFNREIDRILINGMPKLTKVYFQSPEANELIERFSAIDTRAGLQFVPHFDKRQFLIPHEL